MSGESNDSAIFYTKAVLGTNNSKRKLKTWKTNHQHSKFECILRQNATIEPSGKLFTAYRTHIENNNKC